MTFTIYRGSDSREIVLGSKHPLANDIYKNIEFTHPVVLVDWQSWNNTIMITIPVKYLYQSLVDLAVYVNNELGDDFTLAVE